MATTAKQVLTIKIERPTPERLKALSSDEWSLWEKEPSAFEWNYDARETCYILEGRARVRSDIEGVEIRAGDLVTFPKGLKCMWLILEPIKKRYKFG